MREITLSCYQMEVRSLGACNWSRVHTMNTVTAQACASDAPMVASNTRYTERDLQNTAQNTYVYLSSTL